MRLIFVFVFPLFFPSSHLKYTYTCTQKHTPCLTGSLLLMYPILAPFSLSSLFSASCFFFFFNLQKFHWLLIFLFWDHFPHFFFTLSSSVPTTLSERLSKTSDYLHYPHDKNFFKLCITFRISPKLKALCLDLAPKYLSKFMTWGG